MGFINRYGSFQKRFHNLFIDLPVNNHCDEDWCVTTFKKITDDTWKHFNNNLKSLITTEFSDLINLEVQDLKTKRFYKII